MAGLGCSGLMQSFLLLLLIHPLNRSSIPPGSRLTPPLVPKDLENARPKPTDPMSPLYWICFLVELLILGRMIVRKLWRWWREVRDGGRAGRTGQARGCWGSWAALWPRPHGGGG